MNTQTAATTAHVTTRTIQAWCRKGAVTATKTHGRWDIDPDSLSRRIDLGRPRTAEAHAVLTRNGLLIACGPQRALDTAFNTGRPVHIVSGKCAGDTVYLGLERRTYGDYGITLQTTGLVGEYEGGDAGYAIDTARLAGAPALTAAIDRMQAAADLAEARQRQADDDYLNPDYE
jgi:hypothetical protein